MNVHLPIPGSNSKYRHREFITLLTLLALAGCNTTHDHHARTQARPHSQAPTTTAVPHLNSAMPKPSEVGKKFEQIDFLGDGYSNLNKSKQYSLATFRDIRDFPFCTRTSDFGFVEPATLVRSFDVRWSRISAIKTLYIALAAVYRSETDAAAVFKRLRTSASFCGHAFRLGPVKAVFKFRNVSRGSWSGIHTMNERTIVDPTERDRINTASRYFLQKGNTIIATNYSQNGPKYTPKPIDKEAKRLLQILLTRIG